jgi:hypothetical protein
METRLGTYCRERQKTSVDSRVLGNVGKTVHQKMALLSENVTDIWYISEDLFKYWY